MGSYTRCCKLFMKFCGKLLHVKQPLSNTNKQDVMPMHVPCMPIQSAVSGTREKEVKADAAHHSAYIGSVRNLHLCIQAPKQNFRTSS